MTIQVSQTLDASGLSCPMPVVKSKKAMDHLTSGEVLAVEATDPGAKNDLSAWAETSGHEVLEQTENEGLFKFLIQKG